MANLLASPMKALGLGLALSAALLLAIASSAGVGGHGIASFLVRWLHIAGAIIWVGMIWFVNFIQLVAIAQAEPSERAPILKHIVPRVALTFRHASHLVILTGILLLVTAGYLAGGVAGAPAVPTPRNVLMWAGTLGALAMYMFVHMMIWPGLRIVLGIDKADADGVAAARARVAMYARWNLVLAVPVTVAMVGAAHLS